MCLMLGVEVLVAAAVVVSSSCTSSCGNGGGNRKEVFFCPTIGGVIHRLGGLTRALGV